MCEQYACPLKRKQFAAKNTPVCNKVAISGLAAIFGDE
jgi:hypothetical protein